VSTWRVWMMFRLRFWRGLRLDMRMDGRIIGGKRRRRRRFFKGMGRDGVGGGDMLGAFEIEFIVGEQFLLCRR
jgi:hypothetical protein